MKRLLEIVACVIVVGIIAWLGVETLWGARFRNEPSKDCVRRIYRDINVGLSQDAALSIYEQNTTDRTRLRINIFKDTWDIGMPFEFGATAGVKFVL